MNACRLASSLVSFPLIYPSSYFDAIRVFKDRWQLFATPIGPVYVKMRELIQERTHYIADFLDGYSIYLTPSALISGHYYNRIRSFRFA